MGGSICTVVAECTELLSLTAVRREGEGEAAWRARQGRALAEVDGRLLVLFHALVQARALSRAWRAAALRREWRPCMLAHAAYCLRATQGSELGGRAGAALLARLPRRGMCGWPPVLLCALMQARDCFGGQ